MELATECGAVDGKTEPTTVAYAMAKIGQVLQLSADEMAANRLLAMPDGRTLGPGDRHRALEATGFSNGVEILCSERHANSGWWSWIECTCFGETGEETAC